MTDKHKQRAKALLLPWLDNFDIGDELRDQIAETLAHPLSEAVAEERAKAYLCEDANCRRIHWEKP